MSVLAYNFYSLNAEADTPRHETMAAAPYAPEPAPSHITHRPHSREASRSRQRPPLPKPTDTHSPADTGQYWFGDKGYFEDLDAEGRYNAKLAFALAHKQSWFSTTEVACLDDLWYRESNWKTENGGIPQPKPEGKMAMFGADYLTNPKTQILWGFDYITNQRKDYGTPCNAWEKWQSRNPHWYFVLPAAPFLFRRRKNPIYKA